MRSKHYRLFETKQFRQDVRRIEKSGRHDIQKLRDVVGLLREGKQLHAKHKDHRLKGVLAGNRECHIEGDWLLLYRYKQDQLVLVLVRSGTHSQLFN